MAGELDDFQLKQCTMNEDNIIIISDSREQQPLWQPGHYKEFSVFCKKLDTGDYSVESFEHLIAIERKKSPSELYGNFTSSRERFEKVINRLIKIPYSFIVCEFEFADLLNPFNYIHARDSRQAASITYSSILSIFVKNKIPVIFAGRNARSCVYRLLLRSVRDINEQVQSTKSVKESTRSTRGNAGAKKGKRAKARKLV